MGSTLQDGVVMTAGDIKVVNFGAVITPVTDGSFKNLPNGTTVSISMPMVATVASGTFTDGSYYMETEDRSCGIKAIGGGVVADGSRLTNIIGTLNVDSGGEKILEVASMNINGGTPLTPLGMTNKTTIDELASGLLVKTWGVVLSIDGSYITMDDGSGVTFKVILSDLSTSIAKIINKGDHITVTGPVGSVNGVVVVRPRGDADIDKH